MRLELKADLDDVEGRNHEAEGLVPYVLAEREVRPTEIQDQLRRQPSSPEM